MLAQASDVCQLRILPDISMSDIPCRGHVIAPSMCYLILAGSPMATSSCGKLPPYFRSPYALPPGQEQ